MSQFTDGDKNMLCYLQYGKFPAPPIYKNKAKISTLVGLGDSVMEIIKYRGEKKPRRMQPIPFEMEVERTIPGALTTRTPLGDISILPKKGVDWIPIIGISLAVLNFLRKK